MKCSQCGNEVNPGAVCSVCGKAAPIDDIPTMASEPIISVKIPGNDEKQAENPSGQGSQQMNGQNNPYIGNNTMGQPQYQGGQMPYQGNQVPYQGGQMPYQGNQPQYQGGQMPYQGSTAPYQNGQTTYQGGNIPPEPNKSKAPFIVAGVILAVAVIAIIILIVLIVGNKDDKDKDKYNNVTTVATTEEITTEATTGDGSTEEIKTEEPDTSDDTNNGGSGDVSQLEGDIVYEDEYVAITLTTPEMTSYNTLYAYGQILNKTSNDLYVSNIACSLDGICVEGYMYTTVSAGSINDIDFTIYGSDLETSGITHIDNIDVFVYGSDNSTYDRVFDGQFTLSCNVDTGLEPTIDLSGYSTIYEDSYVVVKASKDIYHDSTYGAYYSYLYIESKVDDFTTVMLSDTYIDGVEVSENGGWEDIAPKSAIYADVYWYEDDLGDNTAFNTITMELDLFNYSTWEDYTIATIEY